MGKEKVFGRHNPLRPFFGLRNTFGFFRRRKTSAVGLTPVRFLVVLGTIGILVAAALLILNPIDQMQKGRDDQRKSDLSQIQKVLEQYYRDNGQYPSHSDYKIVRLDGSVAEWGAEWLPYMAKLPKDPLESRQYIYYAGSAKDPRQSYRLYASFERGNKDQQACQGTNNECSNVPSGATCGGISDICNYGVSSANVSP